MKKLTPFRFIFAVIASGVILLTSCQPTKPDLGKIRNEIQAMENAYAAGMDAKDANAVVAYYADDAISMVDNEPIAVGKDALLKMVQKDIADDTINAKVSFEVVDIFASGDLAVETGKAIFKDPQGTIIRTGKYMALYEKRDGKYVCIRDIYNNDKK